MDTKRILIIGGTSGFGKGIAEYFANETAEDWEVVVESRRTGFDVQDHDYVRRYFEDAIPFNVVVYSAGLAVGKDHVKDKHPMDSEHIYSVNTIGLLSVLKNSFEHLVANKGSFIHIGSIAHALSYVGGADYCGSKAASNTIMKTIRKEWLGTGIRTTSMEVGMGDTNFHLNRYAGNAKKADNHTGSVRQIQPIDLGAFIYYIVNMPEYLNVDEVIYKPIDMATHGCTIDNAKQQF